MHNLLRSADAEDRAVRWDDPRAGHHTTSVYLAVFTCLYALLATTPFWTWEALEPPATTTTTTAATATGWPDAAEAAGNGTMSSGGVPAFSQICRFSWEYAGLAMRCATLLLLLTGCVVSLLPLRCGSRRLRPPPAVIALLGVLAGILGLYGELLLWLGTELVAPNAALRPSQICCTLVSAVCFLTGILVHRLTVTRRWHAVAGEERSGRGEDSLQRPTGRSLGSDDAVNLPRGTRPGGCAPARILDNGSGVGMAVVAVPLWSGEVCCSGGQSSEEEGHQSQESLLTIVEGVDGSGPDPEDVPSLQDGSSQSDDLMADAPNHTDRCCHQTHNLREEGIDNYGFLADNGDFDHRAQYIDDDLFSYHSSDDDELKTFLHRHANNHDESGPGDDSGDHSKTPTSLWSTSRLIFSEQALMMTFCDSEEYLSLSGDDEESSDKNRTWP